MTIWALLGEGAAADEPFRHGEIVGWFRRCAITRRCSRRRPWRIKGTPAVREVGQPNRRQPS